MKKKICNSIALCFLSVFLGSLLAEAFKLNVPAFFLSMAVWFFALGVGLCEKGTRFGLLRCLRVYSLVLAFCMNAALVVPLPFFYNHSADALIYVDYWTCLLYGLIFAAAGLVVTTIVLLAVRSKRK